MSGTAAVETVSITMFKKTVLLLFCLNSGSAEFCGTMTGLNFILVQGKVNDTVSVPLNQSSILLTNKHFCKSKRTVIYTFGYTEFYASQSVQTVVSAFLTRDDFNILVFDWSLYDGGNYFLDSLSSVVVAGTLLGQAIVQMSSQGFNIKSFYLVGHSLGAHVVGQAGGTAAAAGILLPRITGLDPAGPGYFPLNPFLIPLNRLQAAFVDIIHTNSAVFGGLRKKR